MKTSLAYQYDHLGIDIVSQDNACQEAWQSILHPYAYLIFIQDWLLYLSNILSFIDFMHHLRISNLFYYAKVKTWFTENNRLSFNRQRTKLESRHAIFSSENKVRVSRVLSFLHWLSAYIDWRIFLSNIPIPLGCQMIIRRSLKYYMAVTDLQKNN